MVMSQHESNTQSPGLGEFADYYSRPLENMRKSREESHMNAATDLGKYL